MFRFSFCCCCLISRRLNGISRRNIPICEVISETFSISTRPDTEMVYCAEREVLVAASSASGRLSTVFRFFFSGMCFGDEKWFKVSVQGLDSKFSLSLRKLKIYTTLTHTHTDRQANGLFQKLFSPPPLTHFTPAPLKEKKTTFFVCMVKNKKSSKTCTPTRREFKLFPLIISES